MKAILILAATLLTTNAFAGGYNEYVEFSYSVTAQSESAALEKVKQTIPKIISGEAKSHLQKRCWPNNERTITVHSVDMKKYYTVDSNNNLSPVYLARIDYSHSNCRER